MRISTSMIYSMGRDAIMRQSAEFMNTQLQLASGKRILKPSDDPAAVARVLEVSNSKSVNLQHRENQGYARDALRMAEGTLTSVSDLLVYVRTRAVEAGNPLHGQGERNAMAADLRAQFEQLRGLANTRDAEGNYIFSGFQITTEPFAGSFDDPPTTYAGDDGVRNIQVSASRLLPVSTPGSQIFGDDATGVFADLRALIADLEDETLDSGDVVAAAGVAIARMDAALDRVLTERASLGSRLVELDALDHLSADYDLHHAQTISRLQDLDYAEGISRFSLQQTMLEAAQQSYVRVTGLSLFNFLR